MMARGIVRSYNYRTLFRFKNPSENHYRIPHFVPPRHSSLSFRPFSFSALFDPQECTEPAASENIAKENEKLKKPLSIYFNEAVGLLEKRPEDNETGVEGVDENTVLKEKLRKLAEDLRLPEEDSKSTKQKEEGVKRVGELFKNQPKSGGLTLSSLFVNGKEEGLKRVEEPKLSLSSLFVNEGARGRDFLRVEKESRTENSDYKPLSPDMEKFVIHLYKNGYFRGSTIMLRNRFDITCFENSYAKDYIRFAAEQFGRDNREIAKWLSGSDLKKVASFGCPSLAKKIVFSAKALRRFFGIHENTVCDKCVLKHSCKFVNHNGRKGDNKHLDLAVVMRVIPQYALESVPPQLVVPEEVKNSANRLLKEAVNLSTTLT